MFDAPFKSTSVSFAARGSLLLPVSVAPIRSRYTCHANRPVVGPVTTEASLVNPVIDKVDVELFHVKLDDVEQVVEEVPNKISLATRVPQPPDDPVTPLPLCCQTEPISVKSIESPVAHVNEEDARTIVAEVAIWVHVPRSRK